MTRTPLRPGPILRATLPVLIVLSTVEVGAGLLLDGAETTLLDAPSLLVLVPVTIGTAGSLSSVLAARLSTALHLGTLSFATDDETLAGNALATVALAVTLFPLTGGAAWLVATAAGGARLPVVTVVAVATVTGLVLSVLAVVVTVLATFVAYRRGLDPDDVAIPVVTNVADVLGVVVLLGVAWLVV